MKEIDPKETGKVSGGEFPPSNIPPSPDGPCFPPFPDYPQNPSGPYSPEPIYTDPAA